MLAVIRTGGKQYKAEIGKQLTIEKINANPGESFDINEVLLLNDGKKEPVIGNPLVENASVKAKLLEHIKGDKIIVFKKKRRQNYRRKQGHRQELSRIEITNISSK